jgi:hypothetical protein
MRLYTLVEINRGAVVCGGRNGTYYCQRVPEHDGKHAMKFRSAGVPKIATWTTAYSDDFRTERV